MRLLRTTKQEVAELGFRSPPHTHTHVALACLPYFSGSSTLPESSFPRLTWRAWCPHLWRRFWATVPRCPHPRGDRCPPRLVYSLPVCTGTPCRAALERDFRPPLSGTLRPLPSRAAPQPVSQAHCPFVPCEPPKSRVGWGGQVSPPPFMAAISLPTGTFWKTVVSQAKRGPPPTGVDPLGQPSCTGCDTHLHLSSIHAPAWLVVRA